MMVAVETAMDAQSDERSLRASDWRLMSRWPGQIRRVLLLLVLFGVVSCDAPLFPGRIPSDSVEVTIDLQPGASETYLFEIEVETLGTHGGFSVRMSPDAWSLEDEGVVVEQSWSRDGIKETSWPENFNIEADERLVGHADLTLVNESDARAEFTLVVTIEAAPVGLPNPSEDDIRLAIRQR